MNIPLDRLATILGAKQAHVSQTVAALSSAFTLYDHVTDNVLIAAIATVRVECPKFIPEHEYGTDEYFRLHYDLTGNPHKAMDLGNVNDGDGIRYAGRGYIQLTGRANYLRYGVRIGVDLETNPDLALQPDIAAKVFATYFHDTGCIQAANVQDWALVRKKVNGGLNQLDLFLSIITQLLAANQKEEAKPDAVGT